MITTQYARTMARYNRWQNQNLYQAANSLSAEERDLDRGAFFGSIRQTLNHIYWGDKIWMSRLNESVSKPSAGSIGVSIDEFENWDQLVAERPLLDEQILSWAEELSDADLQGDLNWYSSSVEKDMSTPRAICITHMFNHQTHHRGQVHAMLTAAGVIPSDTDLCFMPENV